MINDVFVVRNNVNIFHVSLQLCLLGDYELRFDKIICIRAPVLSRKPSTHLALADSV